MCNVTPCSRRSWTRNVVASTSLDASSSTSTFHTAALAGGGWGVEDRPLADDEPGAGTLRLSSDSNAAVCEPNSVGEGVVIVRATQARHELVGGGVWDVSRSGGWAVG